MLVDTHTLIVDLSTAQQQMVEVAKALSIQSKILIMDEPTSSLSERETEQLFATIHQLNAKGIGIIYISHRLQEIREVGDRVTVLRDGQWVGQKAIHEVTVDELVGMMVGHSVAHMFKRDRQPRGAECLRVENLCKGKRLHDISLSLHSGEIVGLAGLVGSGRTDLARAIFGVDPYDSGDIYLFGNGHQGLARPTWWTRGVSLIPEDRKNQGLALILPVAENIVVSSLDRLFPTTVCQQGTKRTPSPMTLCRTIAHCHPLDLTAGAVSLGREPAESRSGKMAVHQGKVFIFDEPTRGVDVGAKAEIHSFMNESGPGGRRHPDDFLRTPRSHRHERSDLCHA